MKQFPIIQEGKPVPSSIPWSVAEKAYSAYSHLYGKSQTLERLSERGGFYASEMDRLYPEWINETDEIQRLRDDLNALQHALVGDTGLSAIQEAHRLRALDPLTSGIREK